MDKNAFPVYCLDAYPESKRNFYINKLDNLLEDFDGHKHPHSHSFYMILFIQQGSGSHTIDFKTYPIEPHTLYFLTPGQVHSWSLSSDTKGYVLFFEGSYYLRRYPDRLYNYPYFHSNQAKPTVKLPDEDHFVCGLIEEFFTEYEEKHSNREEVILSYLNILLERAARYYISETTKPSPVSLSKQARLREFEILIDQHFKEKKTVSEYADLLYITPNHLNAICKKTVNKTASQLIQERVFVEAQRLLLHSDLSIKEVAYALNFEDSSYFSRYFKKHSQQTPDEFRRRYHQHSG